MAVTPRARATPPTRASRPGRRDVAVIDRASVLSSSLDRRALPGEQEDAADPADRERSAKAIRGRSSGRPGTVGTRGARQVQPGHESRRRGGARGVDREVEGHLRRRGVDADLRQPRRLRHPAHPRVGPQVVEERGGRRRAVVQDQAVRRRSAPAGGSGSGRSGGTHRPRRVPAPALPRPRIRSGHPRVVGRDRDVDGGPVADGLTALGGGIGIEDRGEEDRRACGVELEHLGGVRREPEAVVLRPRCRLRSGPPRRTVTSSASMRTFMSSSAERSGTGAEPGLEQELRLGLLDESLQGPVAALLDVRRDARGVASATRTRRHRRRTGRP